MSATPQHRRRFSRYVTPLVLDHLQLQHRCGRPATVTDLVSSQYHLTIEALCHACGCYFYVRKDLHARRDHRSAD